MAYVSIIGLSDHNHSYEKKSLVLFLSVLVQRLICGIILVIRSILWLYEYFVSYICYANKDIFVTISLWRCNYMYCSCVVCSYYIRIIRVHTSRTYRLYCVLYNVRVLLNLYSLARISGSE